MALGAMEIMRFFYDNFQILFQTADISLLLSNIVLRVCLLVISQRESAYGTLNEAELEVVNNVKRPQQLENVGESGTDSVDIELKYKDGWTAAQKAEADAKVKALSDATTVKTPANRGGTSASSRYKSAYGKSSVPSGYDVDHTIDLQLGGADDILNMNPLDMSVNRSLGVQIKNTIKDYPDGTVFGQFTIK